MMGQKNHATIIALSKAAAQPTFDDRFVLSLRWCQKIDLK
jgi:hypothetical protein